MPKKVITKKGDEGLEKLMSPGVAAKVASKDFKEEEIKTEIADEVQAIDFESLIGAALIAIGIGVLIGLAFAFIMRDSSSAIQAVEEIGLSEIIPQ